MPKSSLARRSADLAVSSADAALALRLEGLGLTEEVIGEAVRTHITAMRSAMTPRGAIDYTARQRSADALLALARLATPATDETRAASAPLVSLTLVQTPQPARAPEVIEADPL